MYLIIIKIFLLYYCLHSASPLKGTLERHNFDPTTIKKLNLLSDDLSERLGVLIWTNDGSRCNVEQVPPAYDRNIGVVTKFWTFEKDKGAFTLNALSTADRSKYNSSSNYFVGHVVCRATILRNASIYKFFDSDILYTVIKHPVVIVRSILTGASHDQLICSMERTGSNYLKWRSDYIQINAEDYTDCSNATHKCTQLIKEFTNDINVYCQYYEENVVLEEYMMLITIKVKELVNTAITNTYGRFTDANYKTISNMDPSTTITSTKATTDTTISIAAISDTTTGTTAISDATTGTTTISDATTGTTTINDTSAENNTSINTVKDTRGLVAALSATITVLCILITVCAVLYYRSLALRRLQQVSTPSPEAIEPSPSISTESCTFTTAFDITGYRDMTGNIKGFIPIYDQIQLGHCDSVIPEYANLDVNEPIYEYVECNRMKTPAQLSHLSSFRNTKR